MIYKSTSIKDVIRRVISGTRLQDSSFIQDMNEWIPEAMGYMRTRVTLSPKWKDIKVEYYKAKLPCDLKTLSAVAYGCTRMRHNNSGIANYGLTKAVNVGFVSQPVTEVIPEVISKKIFTANTSTGNIWSIGPIVTTTGDVEVANLINTDTLTADIATLNINLNNLGLGTFLATWDGNTLTIEFNGTDIVSGIKYHQVTLDSPILLMSVIGNTSYNSAYETNSLDSIQSLQQCNCLPYSAHTYYTELDYINTSLCDGTIRIFYKAIPIDEDGFPYIPDNEDYKEAIYWYVRAKMIGAGYEDSVFKYNDCEDRFWKHAGRAIGQIRYPSVDQVETTQEIFTRLILPEDYFETFFTNPGKEGMIDM